MTERPRLWTADDWWAIPGEGKLELWYGAPVGIKPVERRLSTFRRFFIEATMTSRILAQLTPEQAGLVGPGFGFVNPETGLALLPPDIAYLRNNRLPEGIEREGVSLVAPDLAVEILAPMDDRERAAADAATFLAAGVTIVWVIDPMAQTAAIHDADRPVRNITGDDSLDGGTLLPELAIPLGDLFA
jgi:Uma2 family endonuclease